jgi:hypothetical protein
MNDADDVRYLRLQHESGLPFVRERLGLGKTLSHLVLDRLDFSEGTVISTLPEEVGVEAASSDLEFGGKMPSARPPIRGYHIMPDGRRMPINGYFIYPDGRKVFLDKYWAPIQTMISDFLGRHPGGLCIFESQIRSARDTLDNAIGHLVFFGDEVYTILGAASVEAPEWVSMVISQNSGAWLQVAVLTSLPEAEDLPPHRGEFGQSQLEALAELTEAVIIEAYDSEGHIVWTRTNGERWLAWS